jgi:hypothetical protein
LKRPNEQMGREKTYNTERCFTVVRTIARKTYMSMGGEGNSLYGADVIDQSA